MSKRFLSFSRLAHPSLMIHAISIFLLLAGVAGAAGIPATWRQSLAPGAAVAAPRTAEGPAGTLRYLSAPQPDFFPVQDKLAVSAEAVALSFLKEHDGLFAAMNPAVSFKADRIHSQGIRSFVRLRQHYQGIPVWGADMAVQTNGTGGVSCVIAHLAHDLTGLDSGKVPLIPALNSEAALRAILESFSGKYTAGALWADVPELMVYIPEVVGAKGPARLVWKTIVHSLVGKPLKEFILLDARDGTVVLRFSMIHNAFQCAIYDRNNVPGEAQGTRVPNAGSSGIADADAAYGYFQKVYDFFLAKHSRHSYDDMDTTITSTVRYVPDGETAPYQNAFWDGAQLRFGDRMCVLDVTGHEYTHAVTDSTSQLIYLNDSGAINESLSDMWGEWIDQANGKGVSDPSKKWLMGEDLPAGYFADLGGPPLRNMKDPTQSHSGAQPDRLGSPNYYNGSEDNGGVHTNSGVGNKLCFLLTDGTDTGTQFNGQTVTGLGLDKACKLFYECQTHLLVPGATYPDLYVALAQAADNLGFSAAEKAAVDAACLAVEIRLDLDFSNYYKFNFKDKAGNQLALSRSGIFSVDDANSNATLKITKIKGKDSYPDILRLKTAGAITNLYTEANILGLQVGGSLNSLTAKNCYVRNVNAGAIGKVSMTRYASFLNMGESFSTSLFSGPSSPSSTAPPSGLKMSVTLNGIGLGDLRAFGQGVELTASSKKWKSPDSGQEVSVADVSNGNIQAGEIRKLSVVGGSLSPGLIYSTGTGKSTAISAKGISFSMGSGNSPLFNGGDIGSFSNPIYIFANTLSLAVNATGGNVVAMYIQSGGKISSISSKAIYYNGMGNSGGIVAAGGIQSGVIQEADGVTSSTSPVSGTSNIALINADWGFNVGPVYDSYGSFVTLYYFSDDTIIAGANGEAAIGTIQTKNAKATHQPDWVNAGEAPYIAGTAYAAKLGKLSGGQWDGYFTWYQ